MRTLFLGMAMGLFVAGAAMAGECAAPQACDPACGARHGDCTKCGGNMCCKVVPETREIKKTVWNVKCEPFCSPLPGCNRGCGECSACGNVGEAGCDCSNCGKSCDPCAKELAKKHVAPQCGPVRYKKVLEKKEITCKVPSFKCVPVCDGCGCSGSAPAEKSDKSEKTAPAPAPTPAPKTAMSAPMPPLPSAYAK